MARKSKEERDKALIAQVVQLKIRAEHETLPDRNRWQTNAKLFKGEMPWDESRLSQPWMSKPFLHEFSPLVRRMADALSDILFDKEDFLEVEAYDNNDQGAVELSRIFSKLVRYFNDKAKVQTLFHESLLAGGRDGVGILKFYPETCLEWTGEEILERIGKEDAKLKKRLAGVAENVYTTLSEDDPTAPQLLEEAMADILGVEGRVKRSLGPKKRAYLRFCLETVSPISFFYDPDAKRIQNSKYYIERIYKPLYELESYFETGFFDPSKRKELEGLHAVDSTGGVNISSTYEGQKLELRNQYSDQSPYTPIIEILEYFGPEIEAGTGKILDDARHIVIAGGKVILRNEPISWFSQKPPYLIWTCAPIPDKQVGAGVADNAIDHQLLINDLFAVFIDALKLAVYSPKVYDDTGIRDPEDLEGGLYPGQVIRGFKNAKEIFSDIPFQGVNFAPYVFQTIELLRLSGEKGAGVDVQSGNPASRARISAREIQANTSRTSQSLNNLARNLDENLLEPYTGALIAYILQYGLEKDVLEDLRLYGIISQGEHDLIANIPRIERYHQVRAAVKIRVKGFRERIEKTDFLARTVEFLNQYSAMPPEAQTMIDTKAMLKDIVDAFGFDGNRWVIQNNPQDKAREENRILANDQLIAVGPNDEDALELPIHYEQALSTPNNAVKAHIQGHLEKAQMNGAQIPPMPPEVEQALGLAPPPAAPQPRKKTVKTYRDESGNLQGEIEEEQPVSPVQ